MKQDQTVKEVQVVPHPDEVLIKWIVDRVKGANRDNIKIKIKELIAQNQELAAVNVGLARDVHTLRARMRDGQK